MIGRVFSRIFTRNPPAGLPELFLFNVGEIEAYLRTFLKKSAEVPRSHHKPEEITIYALSVATLGWHRAELGRPEAELQNLQDVVLRRATKDNLDPDDLIFLRSLFGKRFAENSDYHLKTLGLHKDGPREFSNEAGTALVIHFVGCATGLQLSPHLMFGCNLEFIRTLSFVDMCCKQFSESIQR